MDLTAFEKYSIFHFSNGIWKLWNDIWKLWNDISKFSECNNVLRHTSSNNIPSTTI